ncbi:DUF402 domain-containing protein [Paenibacillus profundus]|uniref:DUF402 domain-containing protein n=1 Tax=Paenibacillus profundus TaxID=1173085 RepID=A0ABS8YIQ2_9BACL|nr:DUF402 domain-containing protein [Paenibacillus profundus]MCE5170440.1 DUF402 domain-containing protein [Paenibacillus profundus]
MKRKYADRGDWKRILSKDFALTYVEDTHFTGHVSLIKFNSVRAPLVKEMGGTKIPLVNTGYYWMQHFPLHAHYSVTTMFNDQEKIVQWYIDICEHVDVDQRGIPYYDDLYLDVVLLPSGQVFLLDENELEEALEWGRISKSQYDLAVAEASRFISRVKEHPVILKGMDYFRMMKPRLRTSQEG